MDFCKHLAATIIPEFDDARAENIENRQRKSSIKRKYGALNI